MTFGTRLFAALIAAALPAMACQSATPDTACEGGLCDDPDKKAAAECKAQCSGDASCVKTCRREKATDHCEMRRSDAVDSSNKAFTKDAVRWACSDVEGVTTEATRDDRGQEYCEYYAIVTPPPATSGGDQPAGVAIGKGGTGGERTLKVNDDQLAAIEDAGDAVIGQCIFTSWHSDIEPELPVCTGASCPELSLPDDAKLPGWMTKRGLGHEMTAANLKMVGGINSNGAASDLAEKCMTAAENPRVQPESLAEQDDYTRACMVTFDMFTTEWRRSDPTICAATMRAAECGCGVDTDGDGTADITDPAEIARALVPPQADRSQISLRGFRLGTWSDASKLPAGCRYMPTGDDSDGDGKADDSQTVVSCNLTATDVIGAEGGLIDGADVKNLCRSKYGDNVVVHIPIPAKAIVCNPPKDAIGATCGQMVPWTGQD